MNLYFDNAATTFPKPLGVSDEMKKCIDLYCGNPGRSAHYMSRAASEKLFELRCMLAEMYGAPSCANVVFTLNTTYAINTALKCKAKHGDHILISDLEHNSVLRSVHEVCRLNSGSYSVFSAFKSDPDEIISDIRRKIRNNTSIIICLHASNICGAVLPLERIGKLCREKNIFFIADAAQSAGLYDVDIKRDNIGALCLPAHKGLYGPQGIGAVVFSDIEDQKLPTLVQGGSGSASSDIGMPEYLPDRFEAGTMPTPAAAGFCEGIKFVLRNRPSELLRHDIELTSHLRDALLSDSAFKVYSPAESSMLLFNISDISPAEVSALLDKKRICVRSGLHCAPLAHKTLGTGDNGAVRVSFGAFNTKKDVQKLADALWSIKKQKI